ncbi:outer membrane protein assembly factor BamA [Candidatus Sneabacter namystus]|uniref:Outer membrane protein assembly factor BamA n=1 Tax=Candidatus Sneabacter namystus TaxID=2601646 RepID=A0A5C0UL01_9RICK|nr:outer membrane protein assembly factor BamA [Candidatus Sneabacter namystus]QEK39534.1 outer membrane protein assembly factor BamA [Candidatus Sneabacter namystus]
MIYITRSAFAVYFLLCLCSFANTTAQIYTYSTISIEGNERICKEAIINKIKLNSGNCTQDELNEMVKILYNTGWFEHVNASVQDNSIKITLSECPVIEKISYKGNNSIADSALDKLLLIAKGSSLNSSGISVAVQKILAAYKSTGMFYVKVTPNIIKTKNNLVEVEFNILEGPKIFIKRINIIGNKTFSDSTIKEILHTKSSPLLRFLSFNTTYEPDSFSLDRFLLEKFYKSQGFLDFKVISISSRILNTLDGFEVNFALDEGTRYFIGKVDISCKTTEIPINKLKHLIKVSKKSYCDTTLLEKTSASIEKALKALNFHDFRVHHRIHPSGNIANVTFHCTRYHTQPVIKSIEISGNTNTREETIREHLEIEEGSRYKNDDLQRSKNNLLASGLFKHDGVNIDEDIDEDGKALISVQLSERPGTKCSAGIRYAHRSGIGGNISLRESNLFGKGIVGLVSINKASNFTDIDVLSSIPINRNISISSGIEFSHISAKESAEDSILDNVMGKEVHTSSQRKVRLFAAISNRIAQNVFFKNSISFSSEKSIDTKYDDNDDEKQKLRARSSKIMLDDDFGGYKAISFKTSCIYDTMMGHLDNKKGLTATLAHTYTKTIGCDYPNHRMASFTAQHAVQLIPNKVVLNTILEGKMLFSNGTIRSIDCFSLGGDNLRGFVEHGCSPYRLKTKESRCRIACGGDRLYRLSSELSAIISQNTVPVSCFCFFDCGNIWRHNKGNKEAEIISNRSLRSSYGVGLKIVTPFFPIKMSYVFGAKGHHKDKKDTSNLVISVEKEFTAED